MNGRIDVANERHLLEVSRNKVNRCGQLLGLLFDNDKTKLQWTMHVLSGFIISPQTNTSFITAYITSCMFTLTL